MVLNRQTADNIWKAFFGDRAMAIDPFGREIMRINYGSKNAFSWDIDFIWPLEPVQHHAKDESPFMGGSVVFANVQPLNIQSIKDKGSHMHGVINGVHFQVEGEREYQDKVIGRMFVKHEHEHQWRPAYIKKG